MDWVKPEFSTFLAPTSKKRQRLADGDTLFSKDHLDNVSSTLDQVLKYHPKSKQDLVVHKKKIEEIEFWLKNLNNERTFLTITGPPGCGKLLTLSVLCKTLKIDYKEWISPMNYTYDSENGCTFYKSELERFEDFIIRVCRYSSVLSVSSNRVVIVKDIPNGFIRDSSLFHSFLDKYYNIDNIHVVFIMSDSSMVRTLFPEQIKVNFWVKNISFNPVTEKNVATALTNLVKRFDLRKINPSVNVFIDKISADCNGDLRNAMSTFHFLLAKRNGDEFVPTQKFKKPRCPKQNTKPIPETQSNTISDSKMDIFHGLGRVLYAKKDKGKFVHDPQEIADSFSSMPLLFVDMLRENYLNTFSSIHDVAKASTNLATSEILLQDWNTLYPLTGSAVSVASRGLMIVNSNPIKKFQQFNKGQSKFETLLRENKDLLESTNPLWKGTDILMDLTTYSKHIPYFNCIHKDILYKLGNYN